MDSSEKKNKWNQSMPGQLIFPNGGQSGPNPVKNLLQVNPHAILSSLHTIDISNLNESSSDVFDQTYNNHIISLKGRDKMIYSKKDFLQSKVHTTTT